VPALDGPGQKLLCHRLLEVTLQAIAKLVRQDEDRQPEVLMGTFLWGGAVRPHRVFVRWRKLC